MWLVWLIFCDCGFHSVFPLMDKDKRFIETSWWERLTEGGSRYFFKVRAMLSKSLIQISIDEWGCVPSLLFELRPNYVAGNEDNPSKGIATLSAPDPTAGHCWPTPLPETPGHSWASLGHSVGSLLLTVGSLLLTCGSWCVQGFVCAFQESVSPVLCKFWHLYGGPCGQGHCWPVPLQGTLKHSKAGLAQSLWGLLVPTGFVWSLWASLAGMGFDSKCNFVIISHYQ